MRLIISLLITLSAISVGNLNAQEEWSSNPRFTFRGFGELAIPKAEFARNMDENGWGIGFDALYKIRKETPISIGIAMHTLSFDSKSLRYQDALDGVIYEYREVTASRLFALYGAIRFDPDIDFILKPYVQVNAGYHLFFTNTKIRDVDIDEVVDRIHEDHNSVPGYGLEAGIQFFPDKSFWAIDLRVGYFGNSSVSYMVYNEELDDGQSFPIFSFEEKNSPVTLLSIQLGGTLKF